MAAPDPTILDNPSEKALYDCILELMWSAFQNSGQDPRNALHDVALRWVNCLHSYLVLGPSALDLEDIRNYIGQIAGESSTQPKFTGTNYLQNATNLTEAAIILDQRTYDNSVNIQTNTTDIQNIYGILALQNPIVEEITGARNGINRTFTIGSAGKNIQGGREIELFHNGNRLEQVVSEPLGRVYSVVGTGLLSGFNTVELGFAPKSDGSQLIARYFPAGA